MTAEQRLAEVARKTRRVQDAVAKVRATATVGEVRIEVAADGRITALRMADPALAQAITAAHHNALDAARARAAVLRSELADDPVILAAVRTFAADRPTAPDIPAADHLPRLDPRQPVPIPPIRSPDAADHGVPHRLPPQPAPPAPEAPNPYALPTVIRRHYGLT